MPLGICDFDPEFLNNSPKLKSDTECWPVSMIGCINAIKMVTLPSFLDTFSSSATIWLIHVFLLPEEWERFETNPQNVISPGSAVSEVQIILEEKKKRN